MALSTSVLRRLFAMLVTLCAVTMTIAPVSAQIASEEFAKRQQVHRQLSQREKGKFEPLKDVILATIAPNTWDDVGGEGSIIIVDSWGVAVVSQTQKIHHKIEALLATIRRVREHQDAQHSDSSSQVRASVIQRAANAERRNQIEQALDSKTSFEFLDVPLSKVVKKLQDQHAIPIEIDQRAIEESGITTDSPIVKTLSEISLRSALKLTLRDLGLTYVIEDEVLQITTPEEAETRLITVVYPVKDLAASVD